MDRVLAAVCAAADPARGWRTRERAGKGGVFWRTGIDRVSGSWRVSKSCCGVLV